MCLTTGQHLQHKFKNYDWDFDNDFMNLDLLEGSLLTSDDERAFSNVSDFSEITYGNLPSDTSHTTTFEIDDGRSFSSISDFSENTFDNLLSDTSSVATLVDEPHDSTMESSDSISEDHVSSMIAFLEASRQKAPVLHSFPTAEKHIDETSSEELKAKILVRSDEIQRMDVLSGRGGKSNHHIGNKVFRHLVTEMKAAYQSSKTRTEKASLAESIVEKVHRMGGQFLTQNKACLEPQWRLMTKVEARRKTSQALRETRTLQWIY